jgi:phosphatidate cytidylyltransferase
MLTRRFLSAAVLATVTLAAVYLGHPYFELLVAACALVLAWEWNRLCAGRPAWLAAGLVYIGLPCWALLYLRAEPGSGKETVLWLLAVVWAADTAAYGVGRLVGGPKLSPVISPKKTWSGLIGGIVAAGLFGAFSVILLEQKDIFSFFLFSAAIGGVSQAGDLAESWVKRHFGVKDTSALIPGHGGLFDRVDGLLPAAVVVAGLSLAGKGGILSWM